MNKKQLGAFLKVMGKDDTRPALMVAKVDRYDGKLGIVAKNGNLRVSVKRINGTWYVTERWT